MPLVEETGKDQVDKALVQSLAQEIEFHSQVMKIS